MKVLDGIQHEIDSAWLADRPVKRIVISDEALEGPVAALVMARPTDAAPRRRTDLVIHPNDWTRLRGEVRGVRGRVTHLWGVPVVNLATFEAIGPTNGPTEAKTPSGGSEAGV